MKKFAAILLTLILVLGMVSCSQSEPNEPGPDQSKPTDQSKPNDSGSDNTEKPDEVETYKFGIIYTANNYFWDKVGVGGQAKADELNATGKYDISVYATGPQTTGAAGQIQLFEDMISQGYDGIIISCSDTTALLPSIDKAADLGIPVVCMDTEVPDSKRLCFVGTNNYNFGCDVANELARVCDEEGGVMVQLLDPAMLAMAERLKGFEDTIAKYPNMEILFTQADSGADFTAIAANLETMVAKYSDFKGYAMLYAGGENAINIWKANGWTKEDKRCVLSDDLDFIIWGVKDGTVDSTVVQNQYNWGYEGIRVLVEYLSEGITPPDFVETICYACTKELADQNYPDVNPEE